MCGIAGILRFGKSVIDRQKIVAMNTALSHRGPDDEGYFHDEKISLSHKRLSIIDLSPLGHQPMKSSDGRFVIVFNGEMYNFREVKEKLRDYPFQSHSDTEVILAAYRKWGKDCLQYFNGMFAFAIWDMQNEELFIARDRLGKKPLYYFSNDDFFIFSSEIRSLLSSDLVPRKLNREGVVDFLRYQTVHAPETILQDVRMLLPGHFLQIRKNDIQVQSYWSIGEKINFSSGGKSYAEICSGVKTLLLNAVEKRLISDVPLGAFLSGGIDSSVIVGLMAQASQSKIKTFNVSFEEKEFSEAEYAGIIAKKFGTEHHEIRLTPQIFLEQLPDALKALDHPSGDGPNTYIISQKVRQAGITVALSGLGGDELFCGYDIFKRSLMLSKYQWIWTLPGFFRNAFGEIFKIITPGISAEKIAQLLLLPNGSLRQTYPVARQLLSDHQVQKLTDNFNLPENAVSKIISNFKLQTSPPKWTESVFQRTNFKLTQVSIAEILTYMQNVLLRDTDQMSMAHALEVRTPFLDVDLVEYVLGIEDKLKYPVFPKKLLVDAMGDLLPPEIVYRKKMGFTFPWEHWIKNELGQFCESHIHSLAQRDFINEKQLKELWTGFLNGDKRITWARMWLLVVLNYWLEKNTISD